MSGGDEDTDIGMVEKMLEGYVTAARVRHCDLWQWCMHEHGTQDACPRQQSFMLDYSNRTTTLSSCCVTDPLASRKIRALASTRGMRSGPEEGRGRTWIVGVGGGYAGRDGFGRDGLALQ